METSKEKELSKVRIPKEFYELLIVSPISNRTRALALFAVLNYEFFGHVYSGKNDYVKGIFDLWRMNHSQRNAAARRKFHRAWERTMKELNEVLPDAKEEIN